MFSAETQSLGQMLPLALYAVIYTQAEQDVVQQENGGSCPRFAQVHGITHPGQRMRTHPTRFAFHMAQPARSELLLLPEPSLLCRDTAGLTPLPPLPITRCVTKDAILRINTTVSLLFRERMVLKLCFGIFKIGHFYKIDFSLV